MSADPEAMWSNARTLSVQNSTDETVPIAGIRDVTITPAYEHTELYTMDSSFRESVKRYEHNVNVDITYAKFSMELAQEWLGGDPTIISVIAFGVIGAYNGLELGDYLALLRAYKEVQDAATQENDGNE